MIQSLEYTIGLPGPNVLMHTLTIPPLNSSMFDRRVLDRKVMRDIHNNRNLGVSFSEYHGDTPKLVIEYYDETVIKGLETTLNELKVQVEAEQSRFRHTKSSRGADFFLNT